MDDNIENFAESGNAKIFNDAFPKLRALHNGQPLKGEDAAAWDAKMLSQEQHLVQPLYDAAVRGGYADTLQKAASQTLLGGAARVGGLYYGLPPMRGDVTKVLDRWIYGMGVMGYSATSSRMPRP